MKNRFRAWDIVYKKMLDVDILNWDNGKLDFIGDGITYIRKPDKIKLMQSTGLTDKNGKEIFEGDVLKVTDKHRWLEVVSFSEKKAMFVSKEIGFPESPLWELFNTVLFEIEIIGNIYENPELLEVSS